MIREAVRDFVAPAPEIRPWTLRFLEPEAESRFRTAYFRDNLQIIRVGHVFGIATWVAFGLFALLQLDADTGIDAVFRYGIAVPLAIASLAMTYSRGFERFWKEQLTIVLIANAALWSSYRILVDEASYDWGYSGLLLILIYTFTFTRLPWIWATVVAVVSIASYNLLALTWVGDSANQVVFADFFLVSASAIGCATAFGIERSVRLLFLRERELDSARERADHLLRNILPDAIVDQLAERDIELDREYIAEGHGEVTVVFVDLVGFTQQAGRTSPAEMVGSLDEVFSRFDELADRYGLEKIKTVGDAYMAVAGAPQPRTDDVEAAAEMALDALESLEGARWPSGDPMGVRIGMSTGPAVAGVIGRRKFAYDLWGDTVNTASRLESHGVSGRIQVSEPVFERLRTRYSFSEPKVIDLKGKGPTRTWFLLGRAVSGEPELPDVASGGPEP
jgi:class 3 adenylate cyclase